MTRVFAELQTVKVHVDEDGSAWVTLNRPEVANARNQQMRRELAQTWEWLGSRADLAAVVLTGQGRKYFCAGMDLKEAGGAETAAGRRERMHRYRDIEQLAALPQPTIAAINGIAVGGGLEMAIACDLRIMADTAQVGMPEVGLGLMPGGGGTQRLPAIVGYAKALEVVLLGAKISAAEALEIGLATTTVPQEELRTATRDLARVLSKQPLEAVRAAKRSLRQSLELPLSTGVECELDGLLDLLDAKTTTNNTER